MNLLQAIGVAILQGATELFPVSSLGHAVLVPWLLGWQLNQNGPAFLPFLVMLHTGTAAALVVYFWRDWWALATGVLGLSDPIHARAARRLLLLMVVATIPAVLVGFVFNKFLKDQFAAPLVAAVMLIVNGILLLATERLRRGRLTRELGEMTVSDALAIGIWQCGALIPGISRSGVTIIGGLLRGLHHESAAHFSFLIATPIILGATVLEVPKLLHAQVPPGTFQVATISAVVAGIVAWISTAFLMRYFRQNDLMALNPFGYYCIVAGALVTALILV
jgi:undecaprenyl-diphosphatase